MVRDEALFPGDPIEAVDLVYEYISEASDLLLIYDVPAGLADDDYYLILVVEDQDGNSFEDYYYQPPIFDTDFHNRLTVIMKKYTNCDQFEKQYDDLKAVIIAATTTDIVPF